MRREGAPAHLDGRDAPVFEHGGNGEHLVDRKAPVHKVFRVDLDHDAESLAHLCPRGTEDIEEQPCPVLQGPPVVVPSFVVHGGEELAYQVPVGGMQLDPVEPRLLGPGRGKGEVFRQPGCVIPRHFTAARASVFIDRRRSEGCASGQLRRSRASGMRDLRDDLSACIVDGFRHLPQGADVAVTIDAQLERTRLPFPAHIGVARDNQADAAARQVDKHLREPVRRISIGRGHPFPCRGADKPVLEQHIAKLRCLKEFCHVSSPLSSRGYAHIGRHILTHFMWRSACFRRRQGRFRAPPEGLLTTPAAHGLNEVYIHRDAIQKELR